MERRSSDLFEEIEGARGAVRHDLDEEIALELRDLSVFYGSFQALDSVTFDVPRAEGDGA